MVRLPSSLERIFVDLDDLDGLLDLYAPTKAWISGRPMVAPTAYRFAWMYTRLKPSAS